MKPISFKTTWPEYIDFTRKYEGNQIEKFWDEILVQMPKELKTEVERIEPELEMTQSKKTPSMFSISYVFRVPDISNSISINEFLQNFIVNIAW